MKIRKLFILVLLMCIFTGCVKIDTLNNNDIIDMFNSKSKNANTYKAGFQFYVPKSLVISDAGSNYVVLTNGKNLYYTYFDLVSFNDKKTFQYDKNDDSYFSKEINYDNKRGYVEINLWENNQYLIEIMYNYAKIEVMVDEASIKHALINSINILDSVKYNEKIIKSMLEDDKLTYTEEVFDIFEEIKNGTNVEVDQDDNVDNALKEEIEDTDFLN